MLNTKLGNFEARYSILFKILRNLEYLSINIYLAKYKNKMYN